MCARKKAADNRGTSMVTVVLSFALLLIFVTAYFGVQKLAENMMMSSRDVIRNNSQLIREFYLEDTMNETVADQLTLQFVGEDGSFFVNTSLSRAFDNDLDGSIYCFGTTDEELRE